MENLNFLQVNELDTSAIVDAHEMQAIGYENGKQSFKVADHKGKGDDSSQFEEEDFENERLRMNQEFRDSSLDQHGKSEVVENKLRSDLDKQLRKDQGLHVKKFDSDTNKMQNGRMELEEPVRSQIKSLTTDEEELTQFNITESNEESNITGKP